MEEKNLCVKCNENDACLKCESITHSNHCVENSIMYNYFCKLCLHFGPEKEMFMLRNCSCNFCQCCLRQYIYKKIKENEYPIMCPMNPYCSKSGSQICSDEIIDIINKNNYLELYKNHERVKNDDPQSVCCPTPGCGKEIKLQSPSKNISDPKCITCPRCLTEFCNLCKEKWRGEYHHSLRCVKFCPFCSIPITKKTACAQIICKNCRHAFCWYCLSLLDEDILLCHYSKGSCKNKLGCGWKSLFWYRVKTIGIYLGVGIYVTLLLPFWIITLPLLLFEGCFGKLNPGYI